MLGDPELPLNPAGPQLLYLQNGSVIICDFSGIVQLYHSACHKESLVSVIYDYLPLPFAGIL